MSEPIKFKPKGDYSEHIIVKIVDGERIECADIDAMTEEQWRQYCRDTGSEPFKRFTTEVKS